MTITSPVSIPLAQFFEQQDIGYGQKVWVAVRHMTVEQARLAYPYRPHSRYSESHFGGNTMTDDTCLLLNDHATRCKMCQAPTRNEYLEESGTCPDCDGRSEFNGKNPHFR